MLVVLILISWKSQDVRLSPDDTNTILSPEQNSMLELLNPYLEQDNPFRVTIDRGEVIQLENGEDAVSLTEDSSYLLFSDSAKTPAGFWEIPSIVPSEYKCECSYKKDYAKIVCMMGGYRYYLAPSNDTSNHLQLIDSSNGGGSRYEVGPVTLKTQKSCQTDPDCLGESLNCLGNAVNSALVNTLKGMGCDEVIAEPSSKASITEKCNAQVRILK